jgi:hypothetical protein
MSALSHSSWGKIERVQAAAPGIWLVLAEYQSGYWLEPATNRAVPLEWQVATAKSLGLAGWYEESRDAALVVLTFPTVFRGLAMAQARAVWDTYWVRRVA